MDAQTDPNGRAEAGGSQVKTLARGLAVLDMLMAADTVRTTDVAEQLGIDKGACSRILQTLAHAGFAEQTAGRRYKRGSKLQPKQAIARPPVRLKERARPLLQRLHDTTGESVHLAVLADDQVLYIDRVDSLLPLRVDRPAGTLAPLHSTALGKIFLAYEIAPLAADIGSTDGARERLRAQLRQIVIDGYAMDDEEFGPGIRCVAAPLQEAGAVVAAIGLSGPTTRIGLARLPKLGELIAEVARGFPVS